MKKFVILIGSYCSGKTELALNMAALSASAGRRTLVVDLDRINDYFRMSDQIPVLSEKKIELVSPTFVGKGLTQTNMPAAVASAFDSDWDLVIFDVGGDRAGALSLARYHEDFARLEAGSLEVYDIVNVFRPTSETPEKVLGLMAELEDFARAKVTGFVNNSNLLEYTTPGCLAQGLDVLREASLRSGVPVKHTTGLRRHLDAFLASGPDMAYVGEPVAIETHMLRTPGNFMHGKI